MEIFIYIVISFIILVLVFWLFIIWHTLFYDDCFNLSNSNVYNKKLIYLNEKLENSKSIKKQNKYIIKIRKLNKKRDISSIKKAISLINYEIYIWKSLYEDERVLNNFDKEKRWKNKIEEAETKLDKLKEKLKELKEKSLKQ